jgi:hypothetical protein
MVRQHSLGIQAKHVIVGADIRYNYEVSYISQQYRNNALILELKKSEGFELAISMIKLRREHFLRVV